MFSYEFELELFSMCNGEALKCFYSFKSCWNSSNAWKYILSTIEDFYFFDSWIFLGTFFGQLNQYTGLEYALAAALSVVFRYVFVGSACQFFFNRRTLLGQWFYTILFLIFRKILSRSKCAIEWKCKYD